jgi:SAM-dependent methyltransferase
MELFDPAATFNDDYLWFYEPLMSAEWNRQEATEIITALGLEPPASILDAPCGHGRIANALASDGFSVTGIDATPLFLDRARSDARTLGVEVDYALGDLRALPVSGPYDAAVCWFTSFGYFDDVDNRRTLEEFARVLRPGAKLLIETLHHDGFVRGFTSAPAATVTERGDDTMIDVSSFDPIRGRIETDRTLQRDGRTRRSHHSVRVPTVPEFDDWLAGAGYSARDYHTRNGRTLRYDSWRVVVTATR